MGTSSSFMWVNLSLQAADSVGINVYQWEIHQCYDLRALGGLGGFAYIVPSVTTWNFEVVLQVEVSLHWQL